MTRIIVHSDESKSRKSTTPVIDLEYEHELYVIRRKKFRSCASTSPARAKARTRKSSTESLCSTDFPSISRIIRRDSRLMNSFKLNRTTSNDLTSLATRMDSRTRRVSSSNLHVVKRRSARMEMKNNKFELEIWIRDSTSAFDLGAKDVNLFCVSVRHFR